MARGWTRSFARPDLQGPAFLPRILEGIARIQERSEGEEAHRELRVQMKQLFGCEDVSLFLPDPVDGPLPGEGQWTLKVVCGWGVGNVVCQADARGAAALVPGQRVAADAALARDGMLKAIALAYEEDRPWGLDAEEGGLVLLREPTPREDLGSGDISVLALPIRRRRRVGRVVECSPVGVLTLYRTPTSVDLAEIERPLMAILAGALLEERYALLDPVTTLYSEGFLRQELARQVNLFDLTRGKLRGGFVVGWIDSLWLYKQTLEAATAVDPAAVSRAVSALLRGVGSCARQRAASHPLGPGPEHRCGYAGRIGAEGFGVLLPALSPLELSSWARALQRDVVGLPFAGEERLPAGQVTVSLRVIPFGTKGTHTADTLWRLAGEALEALAQEQRRLRGSPEALRAVVGSLLALHPDGSWGTARLRRGGAEDPAAEPPSAASEPATRSWEVEGVGRLLDERPPSGDGE